MASAVATPLEKQFSTIPGLDVMTSSSGLGSTSITLQFTLEPQHRRGGAGRAGRDLPDPAPAAAGHAAAVLPQGGSVGLADRVLRAHSATHAAVAARPVRRRPSSRQRLSTVDGVAQVQVYGSQKYAVRIQLDPQKLQAWKIGIDEVADAINTGNVNLPDRRSLGHRPDLHRPVQRAAGERRGVPAAGRRLAERSSGPAAGSGSGASTGCRTTRWRAGSAVPGPSCSRSSASPAPTPSPWPTGCNTIMDELQQAAPGRRQGHQDVRPLGGDSSSR